MASPQEEALIAARVRPLCGRCHEPAVHADVVPRGVDPPPQPRPLAEQRLVCDLERGRPRTGVAVEGEKARCAEGVDRLRHRLLVELDRSELSAVDAPTGVFDPLSERDQAQEELPRRVLGRFAQAHVDLVGASGQCSRDSTDLVIGSTREDAPLYGARTARSRRTGAGAAPRARLRRPRSSPREARLERYADALGRTGDRTLELVRPQRHDGLDVVAKQLGEAAVEQRSVVEIGPQRRHDPQPAVRIGHRTLEVGEEVLLALLAPRPG